MKQLRFLFWRLGFCAASFRYLGQWWWSQSLESRQYFDDGESGWSTFLEEMSYCD